MEMVRVGWKRKGREWRAGCGNSCVKGGWTDIGGWVDGSMGE